MLNQLYQEILMDHHKDPRNFGPIDTPTIRHEGFNPVCGDRVCLWIKQNPTNGNIDLIQFTGEGCAICMASASMMTDRMTGLSKESTLKTIQEFRDYFQTEKCTSLFDGDLESLKGVIRYPARIKCALLPWTTLKEALEDVTNA